jgi:hypothetical protein
MKKLFENLGLVPAAIAIVLFAAFWPVFGKAKDQDTAQALSVKTQFDLKLGFKSVVADLAPAADSLAPPGGRPEEVATTTTATTETPQPGFVKRVWRPSSSRDRPDGRPTDGQ